MKYPGVRLETERMVLRTATAEDAEAVAAYARANREFHAPYQPLRPEAWYTADFWRMLVREEARQAAEGRTLRLFFHLGDSGPLAGHATFTNFLRGPVQGCTLGYALDRGHEGLGLMTEALRAAVEYVFDEMRVHRISANYVPENERSAAVLRRLGFEIEGRARDYLLLDGRWRDHVLTSLLNPRWVPPPDALPLLRQE